MVLVVATDDQGGMMFNKRRQSQDRILRARILDLAKDSRLWMNAYTGRQFADSGDRAEIPMDGGSQTEILIDDAFLEKAGAGCGKCVRGPL